MEKTKGLFAVIDSQRDAAVEWNRSAYHHALDMQQSFADYAKDHPTMTKGDLRIDDLDASARLLGVVDGGMNQETLSNINNAHMSDEQAAANARDSYEFKKDILRSVFSYAPGGDLVTNTFADGLLGPPPEAGDVLRRDGGMVTDVGLSSTEQTTGHQITQAQYTVAAGFVQAGDSHIDDRFFENGKLLPPNRISSEDWSIYNSQLASALVDRPYVADKLGQFRDTLDRVGGYHK
jgi:hypothetical protein